MILFLVYSFIFMKSGLTKLNGMDQNQNLRVYFIIGHCYCTHFEICEIVLMPLLFSVLLDTVLYFYN